MSEDLKIQLECKQDLEYLEGELRQYIERYSYTTSPEQRERFLADVFSIVKQNIQIDGNNFEGEEVNANLETELEKLQRDTDMLLVKITELRRSCPEMIRERFHLTVEDLERAMPGVAPHLAPLPVSLNITEADIDALVGELERLQKLNKSIPELVSKLQRAKTVISDAPDMVGSAAQSTILAQSLNDALGTQRRIARQHDLATKLLCQR